MGKRWKLILFFTFLIGHCGGMTAQELYKSEQVKTQFFSSAPIEDIKASAGEGISVLNAGTGEISFQVKIRDFQFRKAKMQEHFNENFMESDKYPSAWFKGKIKEPVDLSGRGEREITLVGVLEIHGVKKKREIPATLRIGNGELTLNSRFEVACKDHDIEIPRILWRNIAEVVEVQVNAVYSKL